MTEKLQFSKKIITWYKNQKKRSLPWKIGNTPYKIWISEIMLQQTQVNRVIPYFQRFIYTFPNIKKLARSKIDKILHLWSGLGYYARAHNLHHTAKIIVNKHNAIFPKDLNILMTLPGIGRSTAGAILSLSLKQNYPILDSNIKRILTRYYTINNLSNNKTEQKLWILIKNILPCTNIPEFNQGLMDLGEIICIPKHPKCILCPLKNTCQSNLKNITHLYPEKKQTKIIQKKYIWLLILQYKNKVWIKRCPKGKIWGGLFSFPQFISEKELHTYLLSRNLNIDQCKNLPIIQHKLTHYSMNLTPIILNLNFIPNYLNKQDELWFDLTQPQTIGFPKPILQLLKIITNKN